MRNKQMMMNSVELFGVKVKENVDILRLPEDVLIEILIHLPVKSLMQFRCVSKYWCDLIKSPNFINRHPKRDGKEIVLLKHYLPPLREETKPSQNRGGGDVFSFCDPDSPDLLVSPNLSIPFLEDDAYLYVHLLGHCNGLVCVVYGNIVILCNPALREFELLPPRPFACPEGYTDIVSGSGFGFDANTYCYKVVQICDISRIVEGDYSPPVEDPDIVRIDLYDSSTNSWRVIDAVVPLVSSDLGFNIFFNGACHWEVFPSDNTSAILSFNVSTEVFQQFEFPNWVQFKSLVVLNQCLALVRYENNETHLIDIWVMKQYGVKESWTKELVIGPYIFSSPFLSWQNEWLLVETFDNQLAACALHANGIKRFQFHGFEDSMRAIHFKESLISLNEVLLKETPSSGSKP